MIAPSLFHGVLIVNGNKLICKILVLFRCYMKVTNGRNVYFYGRMCYVVFG